MPTSLTETRDIEAWLSGTRQPAESLLFEAKVLLQPQLADTVHWQQKTYRLLKLYGRQQTKAELKEVEHMLFNHTAYTNFRKKVLRIFNR